MYAGNGPRLDLVRRPLFGNIRRDSHGPRAGLLPTREALTTDLAGTSLNAGRGTFTLGKTWRAELNGRYQAKGRYGFFVVQPYGNVTLGLEKTILDRKGTLKLNVSDLFHTRKVRASFTYDNYSERIYQRQDSRVATLFFSCRFGNDKLAPTRRRRDGAEDEKRRAG